MSTYGIKWFTRPTLTASPLRRVLGAATVVASAALLLSLAGCEINKTDKEGKKGVEINTPFGDLKVKNQAEAKDTGLPVYPGASLKPNDKGNGDKNQATVSLSLFGLKVAVVSYVTDDSPDKVVTWYRDQLKPMGKTIECTGSGRDIGDVDIHSGKKDNNDKDDEDSPVTCDKQTGHSGRKTTEFKMGTERNQRVVAISERKDGKPGAEFALVRVIVGKNPEGDTL
ncbi:MAG: hypothetical protein M3P27_04490 [Acidobacteriota bacterium]|nr:hypothetical protein [Acidobacteriota bacterium]